MRLDKFTVKLQEAVQDAISFATEAGHQQIAPEHLIPCAEIPMALARG